jgi:hypothetical protein
MQHSSGLYLESSDILDDLEDEQYTFTSTTSEQSTRNEQCTPRYIQSASSALLLQEQQAQRALQLQKQQLRRDLQQAHSYLKEVLQQNPGFLYGTDRHLMRYLSDMDAPEDSFFWQSFPTPSTAPAWPAFELDRTPLIPRPLQTLLDTNHIHDRVWNTSAFQMVPMLEDNSRPIIHVVEAAFILNLLDYTDQEILDHYRDMFPLTLIRDEVLLWLINEGRWKAKSLLWLPEELEIIRQAVSDGLHTDFFAVGRFPTAQEIDWSAWEALHRRWTFYPKTYARVSTKCADIQSELISSG